MREIAVTHYIRCFQNWFLFHSSINWRHISEVQGYGSVVKLDPSICQKIKNELRSRTVAMTKLQTENVSTTYTT